MDYATIYHAMTMLIYLTLLWAHTQATYREEYYSKRSGMVLQGATNLQEVTLSYRQCTIACMSQRLCGSVNYNPEASSCSLLLHYMSEKTLMPSAEWIHMSKVRIFQNIIHSMDYNGHIPVENLYRFVKSFRSYPYFSMWFTD